jgi:hypothetical protein
LTADRGGAFQVEFGMTDEYDEEYGSASNTGQAFLDLPDDGKAAAATEFVLNELMKVPAYAELLEDRRGTIAIAVAHISAKFYLDGYNLVRRREDTAHRRWVKGCWVGFGC